MKKKKKKVIRDEILSWYEGGQWTATMTIQPGPILNINISGNTITIDYTP